MSKRKNPASGKEIGFRKGFVDGHWLGRCKAVQEHGVPMPPEVVDARVLFIPQGFEAIDSGVMEALLLNARECFKASAEEMVQRAEELRPDLVLVLNGLHVFPAEHADHVVKVRRLGIQTAIWFADDPYFTDLTAVLAPVYDYVFTHELSCVPFYRSVGCSQVHYLPLGANLTIYNPKHVDSTYRTDVCFIGNAFPNRIQLFDQLAPVLAEKKILIAGALWDQLQQYPRLAPQIKLQWIPIEESVKYYNGAKIVINMHRQTDCKIFSKNVRGLPGYSINPRTYEIAACGALQITDIRNDLFSYYTPGVEIETFSTVDELKDKIDYYLGHEQDRQRIAINGLRRSFLDHSFNKRIQRLLHLVFG